MTHSISGLKVKNFRACKNIELKLSPFTPIVGYNNAGKSNILTSIEWLLKGKFLLPSDFNDVNSDVEVEGVITGLTPEIILLLDEKHATKITPYIISNEITIKRIQPSTATKKAEINFLVKNSSGVFVVNPTGLDNAISALFPDAIRIGAMEDAAEDSAKAKSTSTIGKILSHICNNINQQHVISAKSYIDDLNSLLSHNGTNRVVEFSNIDMSINQKINNLFPGVNLKLHFETPDITDILKSGTIKVFETSNSLYSDCSSYGHGTQRAIQMALIQHLSELTMNTKPGVRSILLIDEPELYLHPTAIEFVRIALENLSNGNYQVIFTTHSASMITEDNIPTTILLRKDPTLGTFSRLRIEDAVRNTISSTPAQSAHLFSLTQSSKILFSDTVVLTEGKTERYLLPYLYEKVKNISLAAKQIALIETCSVDNIKKTMDVLNAMNVPVKAIVDLDYVFRGAISNGLISSTYPAVVALKGILTVLSSNGIIKIDAGGLPTGKNAPCTAAEAFELLAAEPLAIPHIEDIHHYFLQHHDIWVWKKGAIEKHLGLNGKNEAIWSAFQLKIKNQGWHTACIDNHSVSELCNWIG